VGAADRTGEVAVPGQMIFSSARRSARTSDLARRPAAPRSSRRRDPTDRTAIDAWASVEDQVVAD